jgi:hypothetical protein
VNVNFVPKDMLAPKFNPMEFRKGPINASVHANTTRGATSAGGRQWLPHPVVSHLGRCDRIRLPSSVLIE